MSAGNRVSNLNRIFQSFGEWHRSFDEPFGQWLTRQVLKDQIVHPVFIANIVQCANSGVVQSGNRSGFLLESLDAFAVTGHVHWQNFYGDEPIEAAIHAAIDFCHSSLSDQRQKLIAAKGPGHQCSFPILRQRLGGLLQGGRRHVGFSLRCIGQQRFDLTAQIAVVTAGAVKKGCTLAGLKRQSVVVNRFNVAQATHETLIPDSSRSNHAFAKFQLRITVIGEIFIASAVSSTLSPPK